MSELQRIETQALDNLAAEINAEHRACEAAMAKALPHALEAGRMLEEAKAGVRHGEWEQWLEENFEGSARTARVYMQLHSRRDELTGQNGNGAAGLTLRGALKAITGPSDNHRALGTGENEWYTPEDVLEDVRAVLGTIELDPASSDAAQERVQAERYFTLADDALEKEWHGKVFLNPPYSRDLIGCFASKLVEEVRAGRVVEAILLTHNYTDTVWFHTAEAASQLVCFTKGRITFVPRHGEIKPPTQGQAFFYYGERLGAFGNVFSKRGFIT